MGNDVVKDRKNFVNSVLNMRCARGRVRFSMLSWRHVADPRKLNKNPDDVLARLSQAQIAGNTTFGTTPGSLTPAGYVIPAPANLIPQGIATATPIHPRSDIQFLDQVAHGVGPLAQPNPLPNNAQILQQPGYTVGNIPRSNSLIPNAPYVQQSVYSAGPPAPTNSLQVPHTTGPAWPSLKRKAPSMLETGKDDATEDHDESRFDEEHQSSDSRGSRGSNVRVAAKRTRGPALVSAAEAHFASELNQGFKIVQNGLDHTNDSYPGHPLGFTGDALSESVPANPGGWETWHTSNLHQSWIPTQVHQHSKLNGHSQGPFYAADAYEAPVQPSTFESFGPQTSNGYSLPTKERVFIDLVDSDDELMPVTTPKPRGDQNQKRKRSAFTPNPTQGQFSATQPSAFVDNITSTDYNDVNFHFPMQDSRPKKQVKSSHGIHDPPLSHTYYNFSREVPRRNQLDQPSGHQTSPRGPTFPTTKAALKSPELGVNPMTSQQRPNTPVGHTVDNHDRNSEVRSSGAIRNNKPRLSSIYQQPFVPMHEGNPNDSPSGVQTGTSASLSAYPAYGSNQKYQVTRPHISAGAVPNH